MSQGDDLGFELPRAARPSRVRVLAFVIGGAAVISGAFVAAYLPRRHAQKELEATTKTTESSLLRVQVVAPKVKSSDRSMALPGSVQPLEQTTVYPRSNGYVAKWLVDIGDKVAEDTVLAEIEQPEVDQQVDQARAQLAQSQAALVQAQANKDFSNLTLQRTQKLAAESITSQQDLEQKKAQAQVDEANVKVAQAAIDAQKANVRRLTQMKSWAHVTAPFAGTVNARMVERGALVSPSTPLFKISTSEIVRVIVQVPQDVAPSVKIDVPAIVTVREFAGRTFTGKVARSAGALDPGSRTMATEIRVPNPKGELITGMYAQVSLTLPMPHNVYEVPGTAVMSDAKGVRVAVLGPDSKIRLVPVVIERDTGATMELSSGIEATDRIVALGSPELTEGRQVELAH